MNIVNEKTGKEVSFQTAQDWLLETKERCGRIILGAVVQPQIGEVKCFAGLPLRVTAYSSYEEAMKDADLTDDMWGNSDYPFGERENYYFEVEVAD